MAKLGKNRLTLESAYGQVEIKRDSNGIPVIKTAEQKTLYYGLGWVHACDRIMNMELSRLIAQGRGAECLDRSLLSLDITMRRYNLWGDSLEEAKKLTGRDLELVTAYCDGVNERFRVGPLPFEFKLIKHKPDPWTAADVIATLKLIGMVDLTETQGWMERFIIEMIKQGYSL
jgi:penicillin G amidase